MCVNELPEKDREAFWRAYDMLCAAYHKQIFDIRVEAYTKVCDNLFDVASKSQQAIEEASAQYRKDFQKLCDDYGLDAKNWAF